LTPFVLRWIVASLLFALLATEHLRLASRAKTWWAWLVPMAPVVMAFRRGERVMPSLSVIALLGWGALHYVVR
jgi:hypothetical protein